MVFGGLGIATLFTLVLIPVIYSLLAPLASSRAHAGIRLDRELREAEGTVAAAAEEGGRYCLRVSVQASLTILIRSRTFTAILQIT